jgi:hypothetical protein
MLWGEQVAGWANLKVVDGRLQHELGFAGPRPRGRAFRLALEGALDRMQAFLQLDSAAEGVSHQMRRPERRPIRG